MIQIIINESQLKLIKEELFKQTEKKIKGQIDEVGFSDTNIDPFAKMIRNLLTGQLKTLPN